jgi:hypothetical protein
MFYSHPHIYGVFWGLKHKEKTFTLRGFYYTQTA